MRKSTEQWMTGVKDNKVSGINLIAWCRNKGLSKSSIYPYINKLNKTNEQLEHKMYPIE
jgi:hypothetical protein